MELPAAPLAAAHAFERWAWLPVATPSELERIRALAPGEGRRAAAIEHMRSITSAGMAPARAALAAGLAAAGVDATVDAREQLWLDGSGIFRINGNAPSADALRAVDELLTRIGARVIDPADLPPGDAAAASRPVGHEFREAAASPAADGRQWFAAQLGFDAAHRSGLSGKGVRVAVVDSGVDPTHPQLAGALRRGAVHDRFAAVPVRSGHGTFVAGMLAGAAMGLAPGVDLSSSRTYGAGFGDHRGENLPSRQAQRANAIRALQDALAPPDGSRGADVLVASWGILDQPGVPATDYDRAMATLAAAGAVVVAAAGNDGAAGVAVPAQLADVLAVGGVDRELRWHPSASAGGSPRTTLPKPDLAAPVVDMRSTAIGGGLVDTSGNPDRGFAGTSAAAPVAAALVALLTQAVHDRGHASPDLDEVRRVLPLLVRDVDAPGPDVRTGHGVVDASRVHEAAARIVAARTAR